MTFEVSGNPLEEISCEGIIVFPQTAAFARVDKVLTGLLSETVKLENFKDKVGELLVVQTHQKILASRVFILGLGKKEERNVSSLRRALAILAKKTQNKISSVGVSLLESQELPSDVSIPRQSQVIAEGLLLGSYRFNKYKKKEENGRELEVVIFSEDNKNISLKIKEGIRRGQLFCEATRIARDLVNEPAAIVTPTFLANFAQKLAKKDKNIRCRIYDREELEKLGMEAFLGVAQAADTPPKFIHLEYTPPRAAKKKLALVGKGITFDSGGVSIKTSESMQTMRCDMAGAAVVLAVFSVISQIKPPFAVMGLIAATPNLISGKALVPGDILRALNGKTIEVLDTDAEGRITMADSLGFAVKKGATEIIDVATLTGACMVALGPKITGLFTNNSVLAKKIKQAAELSGEKVWELPLEEEYKELNKSEVADIANIPSTRYGGAITAALFLQEFVNDLPWLHLDIAGPAFAEKTHDLGPKGGTGFGVCLLLEFLSVV